DPGARILHKDRRPVIDVVARGIDHLLAYERVNARQTNHSLHELAIRFRVIGGPALKAAEEVAAHVIAETREGPFDFVLRADGHLSLVVVLVSANAPALICEQS